MGRKPCCAKEGLNKGAWSAWEDKILVNYIKLHGEGKWRDLPKRAGLNRCGKSCRLRWLNYLRPGIKRGNISMEEKDLIIRLHKLLGNRWSLIAGRLPGRTDNEIKNYWSTNLRKMVQGEGKTTRQARKPMENLRELNKDKQSRVRELKSQPEPPKVIRTKAVRCTKVNLPDHILHTTVDPEKQPPLLSVFPEVNSPDPAMNFDVDYLSLSEALGFKDVVHDGISCQHQSPASEHEKLMDHARQDHNWDPLDDDDGLLQSKYDAFDFNGFNYYFGVVRSPGLIV